MNNEAINKLSTGKEVRVRKISVPFESPSHYYEVLIINKSEVETYTSFAIQDVFVLIDEFLEGEENNDI